MSASVRELRPLGMARLVCRAPGATIGRTALMKMMYFLQELHGAPLGYDFRLYTYGPFDSEVLSDLGTATSLNMLNERTVLHSRGYGYEITPGTQAQVQSAELESRSRHLAKLVDSVISEFGSFSAADLELRSTIFYVDREMRQNGTKAAAKDVAERVRQIKPHFDEAAILNGVGDMHKKKAGCRA
jgi:uncharacterized protein